MNLHNANLLAIDTATEQFSVAVAADKETWLFEADAGLRHSELVMEAVDMLMQKAGLKPEDLSGVVCMGGPGSFTGLRIGFAVAKGLALSLGLNFAAIPTLDCMAWPFAAWPGIVVPTIDAKKGAFFCAVYRGGGKTVQRLCPDMDAAPPEIANVLKAHALNADEPKAREPILLTGPGAAMLHEQLSALGLDAVTQPGKGLRWGNAQTLLLMAQERDIFMHSDDASTAAGAASYDCGPEYIRKSDAEIQKEL